MTDEATVDDQLGRMKAVRAGHRMTVTKYVKEAEHLIDLFRHDNATEADLNRLHVIRNILKRKIDILSDLNEKILDNCDVNGIENEIEHADDINTTIMCTLGTIEAGLKPKTVDPSVQKPVTGTKSNTQQNNAQTNNDDVYADNQREVTAGGENSNSTVNGVSNQREQVKPKLPKLTIDKFSGDVTKFQTFWDIFQASVNSNQHMSSVDKFSHLKGLLEGRAARAIEGLSLTEANYKAALDILQEQFGNIQMTISAHMDDLLKLPACESEQKLSQLRFVYDKVNVNIRGLEALGVTSEQYGSFLIPVIMSKLPHDICVQIARLTKQDVWKIDDILDILRSEIHAREMSSSIKARDRKLTEPPKSSPVVRRNFPSSASTFTSNTQTRQNQGNWTPNCAFCSEHHYSSSCENVKNINDRRQVLRDKQKCFLCFKTGHTAFHCNSGKCCKTCKKAHHHSVCKQNSSFSQNTQSRRQSTDGENTVTSTTSVRKEKSKVLLQTATAYVSSNNTNQPVRAKILFDSGSQRSYITNTMVRKLKLPPLKTETLNLNTFGNDNFTRKRCDLVSFQIHLNEQDEGGTFVHALSYPNICSPLNNEVNIDKYDHLQGLHLADNTNRNNESVDILIGSDFYWDIVNGDVIRGDSGPVALGSKLGWILSGQAEGSTGNGGGSITNLIIEEPSYNTVCENQNDELVDQLKQFWDVEAMGVHEFAGDRKEQFLSDIHFDKGQNRYEISLPWKDRVDIESNSTYNMCHARLFQLRSRLKSQPDLFAEYDHIIQEQVKSGIIEEVPVAELKHEDSNFLPHHGVVKEDRKTTKLRIVFDGSAKDMDGVSLNDKLETGPNLTPHIFNILLNFRTYQIGLTADIEKAFHQISIDSEDRKKLRFLWFEDCKNGYSPTIKQYQFCRLVFGLTSSPAILNSTIHLHLNGFQISHERTVNLLKDSIYVDDLVAGANEQEEAVEIYKEADQIMKEGGFSFRKWRSNDKSVQQAFQGSEHVDKDADVKVLGIIWNSSEDNFSIDLKGVVEYGRKLPVTKRSILKISAKIFDPLGLLSPFTVRCKVLFQELCKEKVSWDEELEGKLRTWWDSLCDDIELLSNVHIPRRYTVGKHTVISRQLHGFCDASEKAYAAVVYLRTEYSGNEVEIQLVASKTRVSPMKKQSIPRLELLGAVLLGHLMDTVIRSFQTIDFQIHGHFYWTDSFTSLCWIKNSKQWKQYVQHRVVQIHQVSKSEEWNFCPGTINIADLPSRSCTSKQLLKHEAWWKGPSFLYGNKDVWPTISTTFESMTADEEIVKAPRVLVHSLAAVSEQTSVNLENIFDINRYSSKMKLLRITSLVMKFIARLKGSTKKSQIEAKDMRDAEMSWIKSVQSSSLQEQLHDLQKEPRKTVQYKNMELVLRDGIICCQGRIGKADITENSKFPILLPNKHRFTALVIEDVHQKTIHSGVKQTLDSMRQTFWIIKGRAAVKRALRKCSLCKRYEGRPYKPQQIPDLPEYRVSENPPFSYTGVDYAGPLILSDQQKAYVCLFTCASTRAVHLELTPDLSVKSFLEAFRRFTSRRGLPYKLVSDNAKTFKRGAVDIGKIITASRTQNYLINHQVTWEFIVEKAPWWGGFWERMVQLLKRCVRKVIGRSSLNFEELRTLLVEIESTINNRPITYVYDDDSGLSHALTSSDLIYGRRIATTSNDSHCDIVSTFKTLTKHAKHHFRMLTNFTNVWRREYLLGLREYHMQQAKRKSGDSQPAVGDIVIIKDELSARCYWKLGKLVELFRGRDGRCRAAGVQVLSKSTSRKPTCVRRPIQQLVPLEVRAE